MTKGKDDPAADPKDDIDDLDERSEREVRRDRRMEQLQKSIKQRRWQLWGNIGIAAGLIIVIGGVVYNFREVIFQEENIVIAIFIGTILFPFILKILYTGKTDTTSFQADYDRLELEKEISDRKKSLQQLSVEQFNAPVQPSGEETEGEPASKTISYFDDLVQTNIVNLREYYLLVRVHTNNSFRFSLFASSVGFVLIIVGLALGFNSGADDRFIAYIAAGSGVLVEFISGIFFYLYSRTVQQLKAYHNSLLNVQNVLLSFKLIDDSDPKMRSEMIREMLKFLMQHKEKES